MGRKLSERSALLQQALTYVYVCGGSGQQQQVTRSAERLEPSGRWEPLAAMAQRRFGGASAVLQGCFYVCGGSEEHRGLNSAERFDPKRGREKMAVGRRSATVDD